MATHRAFTVEAANQLIPWVESVFLRLDGHRQRSLKHSEGTQILEVMWGDRIGSPDNPDHDEYRRHRCAMEEVARTVQGVIEQDLIARGVRLPTGGLESGIVDFPPPSRGAGCVCAGSGQNPASPIGTSSTRGSAAGRS